MPAVTLLPPSKPGPSSQRLARWAGACLISLSLSAGAASIDDWWFYVRNDFIHRIEPLLKEGVDPNRVSPDGQPTLVEAVRTKAWKTYDAFVALPNINLEATNNDGENALMLLSVLGETQRAKHLIDRGAQVNKLGWTPLHYAASRNKQDIAQLLISRGAMINAPAPDGTTPLMMAALSKSNAMVDLLLKAGADPTTRNLSNLSAADWARSANAEKLAERLDAQALQVENQRGNTTRAPAATHRATPAASNGSNASNAANVRSTTSGSGSTAGRIAPGSNDEPASAGSVGGVSNVRFGTD